MRDRVRRIDDPAVLRALAHPLRLRLLASLRSDGPGTASVLGRRLGESSGATSFHLRTLDRHGFVEEDTERGTARERWWQAVDRGMAWTLGEDDPGHIEASRGLSRIVVQSHAEALSQFLDELPEWPREWREVAELRDRWVTVTPDRLAALGEEVWAIVERYASEPSNGLDAERVMVVFDAIPQRRAVP